ncbi:MAG: cytochrome c3 family protein [Nitrospirae bacterium]|nr:cytochrome c3 family protein [Nitrospirota bacterium]
MKIILTTGLFLSLVMGAGYALYAGDNVANTKHNLSASGTGSYKTVSTTEICIFCHTPHGGSTTAPLWNRINPAGPYNMYNSPTLDSPIAWSPQGISLVCLSCHDGTVAFDALLNKPGSGGGSPSGWEWQINNHIPAYPPGSYIGTDLSDDHPISIDYPGADQETNDFRWAKDPYAANTIRLFNVSTGAPANQVECASCHNPHDGTYPPLLRASNSNSELCLACHKK